MKTITPSLLFIIPFHTPVLMPCLRTFFVPVFNVGSPCNEDRHKLLVSSCTRQRQRCVMVTLRLWGGKQHLLTGVEDFVLARIVNLKMSVKSCALCLTCASMSTEGYRGRTEGGEAMFAGICVGGWDRGVGEVVVFSMGTRLLTAARQKTVIGTYKLGI